MIFDIIIFKRNNKEERKGRKGSDNYILTNNDLDNDINDRYRYSDNNNKEEDIVWKRKRTRMTSFTQQQYNDQ